MANQVKDIQDLINEKADKTLRGEIEKIKEAMNQGAAAILLEGIDVNIGTTEAPKMVGLRWLLSYEKLGHVIFEKHKERYRELETERFLKKVDSIREDVDYLLDNLSH